MTTITRSANNHAGNPRSPFDFPQTMFCIVDPTFGEVAEWEITTTHVAELRAEFKSRRKDWGEDYKLIETPANADARKGTILLPEDTKLGKKYQQHLAARENIGVLTEFLKAGDMTRWGMANAITAQAHTTADYERSVELEAVGGKLMDLSLRDFNRIASVTE